MWILFAFGSAIFSGLTTILAKCGIQFNHSYCYSNNHRIDIFFNYGLLSKFSSNDIYFIH